MSYWEDRVRAATTAYIERQQEKRAMRAEFAEARRHGLATRHRTKLARLQESRFGAGDHHPLVPGESFIVKGALPEAGPAQFDEDTRAESLGR